MKSPTPAVSVGPGPDVFRVGNGVAAPAVTYKIDPNYTVEARKARLEGTVSLNLIVDPTGHPRQIRVVRSSGLGLDEKAIEAVNGWQFRAGVKNGQPVAVMATIEVNFRLLDQRYPRWRLARAVFQLPDGASRPVFQEFAHPKTHDYKVEDQTASVLHFEVDSDGIPRNFSFTLDPDQEIRKDLLTAVKKWRFTPAQKDGMPVSANATFEFVWEQKPK